MLKRFHLFFITALVCIGLVACSESTPENETKNEQPEKQTFIPELQVNSEIIDNQLEVTGETNLPDETVLLITFKDNKDNDIEKPVTVKEGKFAIEPIPIEELKPGEQSIKVSLFDDQPDAVKEVIGTDIKVVAASLVDNNKQVTTATKVNIPAERSPPSNVKGIKTTVTRVVDGDTIKAMIDGKEESVRLILVDTPETKHPQMGVQPFGPEASEFTTKTLEGKTVTLELGVQERDRYGRLLAYIWLGDKLFNQMLLEKGLARVAIYPPNTKYLDQFEATQNDAKKKGIGIWSIENYVQDNGFKSENKKTTTAAKTKSNNTSTTKKQAAPKTSTPAPSKPAQQKQASKPAASSESKDCKIKGSNTGIYHVPGSTYYDRTKNVAQWFCSEAEAQKAGYRAPKR